MKERYVVCSLKEKLLKNAVVHGLKVAEDKDDFTILARGRVTK